MTAYLLKSTLSLLVALGFYRLCLEQEQMARFKRWYLLATLLFSISIPLVSLPAGLPAHRLVNGQPALLPEPADLLTRTVQAAPDRASVPDGWWLYGLVTTIMLARFVWQVYGLTRQIRNSPRQSWGRATLVCLDQETLPYTFLHYLFVSGAAYRQGQIEPELITHELTHIDQRHTLDVLLVELLICVGWFNPLLYGYKRAIQLNHEFLADQAVNRMHQNVTHYQQLLVSKVAPFARLSLTSTLTFQLTKKRLLMMTKQTSRTRSGLTGIGVALLLGGLTIGLGTKAPAQVAPASRPVHPITAGQLPATDVARMERLFGDKMVSMPNPARLTRSRKKFSDLSAREKQHVHLIPPLPRLAVTQARLSDWKNARKYGIWIDDKRVANDELNRYTAQDFGSYSSSKLEKNAINYGKHYYQIDLMTNQGYAQYLADQERNPMLVLSERPLKSR